MVPLALALETRMHSSRMRTQWRIYIVKFWTRAPPPGGPNSFNFMQFLGKFGKIVCWRPPLGSWRPLLGEILDPPLVPPARRPYLPGPGGYLVLGGVPGPRGGVPGPGGVYLVPVGCTLSRGMYLVPEGGVPGLGRVPGPGGYLVWGVYLVWGMYLVPGGVPGPRGGVPGPGGGYLVRGVYLVPGGVFLVPGGVPCPRGVYLVPGGVSGLGGVPDLGGVPGQGGCTWSRGVPGQVLPPPVNRITHTCKNITLPQLHCGR